MERFGTNLHIGIAGTRLVGIAGTGLVGTAGTGLVGVASPHVAKDWKIDATMVGTSSEVRFLEVSSSVLQHWCFALVGGSLDLVFHDLF